MNAIKSARRLHTCRFGQIALRDAATERALVESRA